MTGAIISHYFWKDAFGQYSRYFINGSFFFIEPDLAVTTYSNLTELRSQEGSVYAEDYFFIDNSYRHFENVVTKSSGRQCIRLEREWLQEFPEKNITLINFPFAVSAECFIHSLRSPRIGEYIMAEGYGDSDFLTIQEDPEIIDFVRMPLSQVRKIKLFRQMATIDDIRNEPIYNDMINIDDIELLYTDVNHVGAMQGGPILDSKGIEAIGVLSHEPDDPFAPQKFIGVKLEW